MTQINGAYAFQTQLDLPFDRAKEAVTAALQEEGFGVLTEIDVKNTLKQKLDVDFRKYVILGACNPKLAHQALSQELDVGLLLPCNVIIYEEGAECVVAIADPEAILGVAELPALGELAAQAQIRLQRVMATLAS